MQLKVAKSARTLLKNYQKKRQTMIKITTKNLQFATSMIKIAQSH